MTTTPRGTFDLQGRLPAFNDRRVQLIRGLFQDTLGPFLEREFPRPSSKQIVVHCDADLYASALFVLATLDRFLAPGTVLIFDEFDSVLDEFRAFLDYTTPFRRRFQVLAWTVPSFAQVAIALA